MSDESLIDKIDAEVKIREEVDRRLSEYKSQVEAQYQEALKEKEREYQKILQKKEKEIQKNVLDDSIIAQMGAAQTYIERVILDVFVIRSKHPDGRCRYCEALEGDGHLTHIKSLYMKLKIPETRYEIRMWEVDPMDRFFSRPPYLRNATRNGENYLYATGLLISRFPTIDVTIIYRQTDKPPTWKRFEGLGSARKLENGQFLIEHDIVERLIDLFVGILTKSRNEEIDFKGHKKDEYGTDTYAAKMKKIKT